MKEGCRSEKGEKEAQGGGEDEAGTVALEEDQAEASGGGEECEVRGQERQWHVVRENLEARWTPAGKGRDWRLVNGLALVGQGFFEYLGGAVLGIQLESLGEFVGGTAELVLRKIKPGEDQEGGGVGLEFE